MSRGCLREADREILEASGWQDSRGGFAVIRYLTNQIRKGKEKGGISGIEAEQDAEVALWMARGCLSLGDYEHCRMAVQWLERTGEQTEASAERCELMARGLMYCGRGREALRWAREAEKRDPGSGTARFLTAELLYLAGERDGALEAAEQGRKNAGFPQEVRASFDLLGEGIRRGERPEELEKARIRLESGRRGEAGSPAEKARLEAAEGIRRDEEGLEAVLETLRPEIWDPDEPYCAFCFRQGEREITGAFCMNEAAVSAWKPEEIRRITRCLPRLEKEGRQAVGGEGDLCLLEFYPDRTAGLIFETERGEQRAVVSSSLEVRPEGNVRRERTVCLPPGAWAPEELAADLERIWGVDADVTGQAGEETLLFRDGGLTVRIRAAEGLLGLEVSGEEGKERDAQLEMERLADFLEQNGKNSPFSGKG